MKRYLGYMLALVIAPQSWAESPKQTDAAYDAIMAEICSANNAPVRRSSGTKVFSWTDENGVTHFGERPPTHVTAQEQQLQGRRDYFDVTISYPDGTPSAILSESLEVNGHAIAHVFSQFIPKSRMSKSAIEMKIFRSKRSFLEYKQEVAPSLSNNVAGFYSALTNSVAVWNSGNTGYTVETALHEATHVFQYKNLGMMPGWLSEGLAVYFEGLEVSGQSKIVNVSPYWLASLRKSRRVIPLDSLLVAGYANWQGGLGATYYANSWAVVYFLMLPQNRPLMKRFLTEVSADKCDDVSVTGSLAFFDAAYPGGAEKMQADFIDWLNSDHRVPNYH